MGKSHLENPVIETQQLVGPLNRSLKENIAKLKAAFQSCDDINFLYIKPENKSCLIYLSDIVSSQKLNELHQAFSSVGEAHDSLIKSCEADRLPYQVSHVESEWSALIEKILLGYAILLTDGQERASTFNISHPIGREVTTPEVERTVEGPKEGFVEQSQVNLHLIRQKIRTPSLKVNRLTLGTQTKTQITILYIEGIANEKIVQEVHKRLSRIKTDSILDSRYVQSMISDAPFSPFPTMLSTERPDRVSAELLEGKVAILTDGSPSALVAPITFVEYLHSSEDYYNSSVVSTIIRWVRFLGLFVALILPAFFVAVVTFHQDLLQTPLLIRVAANRANLPYPALVEAIFMYLTYELLREAGLRMPKIFGGPIITILGLILISQAAVTAGVIGPLMSIVVSTTALTAFILPNYSFHQIIRFCGIPLLLLSGFFGFMGILVGLMFGLAHLVSLRSFGIPYLSPVSPSRKEGWKDVFFRVPWWAMETLPPGLGIDNDKTNTKPPKRNGEDHFE